MSQSMTDLIILNLRLIVQQVADRFGKYKLVNHKKQNLDGIVYEK